MSSKYASVMPQERITLMGRLMTKKATSAITEDELIQLRQLSAEYHRARLTFTENRLKNKYQCKKYQATVPLKERKEKNRINRIKWLEQHPGYETSPARMASRRNRKRARVNQDSIFKVVCNLRSRCANAVRRGTKHSSLSEYLGCSIPELKTHLESKWQPGMSWDNYTYRGWHIDHIRPLASFDLADPGQFKVAFHYTNLQPLWALDNLQKSDTVLPCLNQ